jgi:ring-1,2-phenylacetyl-CoA epoxidase subunit PaaE
MSQFQNLTVTNIEKTIRDAVVVTLEPENASDFEFTQGQYLTFRRDFEGQEIRRSYSICSNKNDSVLQVGIKRVSGGAFSTWANTELTVGDTVEAMPPMGQFFSTADGNDPHYLAFAGGSGITPILSILRTGLDDELDARFTLVYANRNPNTIMFREELEDLKNQYLGRFNVIHVLEDESQEIDLFRGRVDGEKCAALFEAWIDIKTIDKAFICGPEPMMLAISDALEAHGLSKDQIRFELFASGQPGCLPQPVADASEMEDGIEGRVTIGGVSRSLTIPNQTSLLDAALANNLEAPYACKAGVCSTCKCKVLEGEVEMITNHALEDYEVEAGFVLSCQAYPVSAEKVVWDYDEAGH